MNDSIEAMLAVYKPKDCRQRENAIKEIIQEIALAGLYRGGFFDVAAFYGGTCLRIFHGLNRFSEDLDFALLERNEDFKLDAYFPALKKEFEAYGLEITIEQKQKNSDAVVQSAFLKGNTLTLMLSFFPKLSANMDVAAGQKVKVKFEVDVDNPSGGTSEFKYRLLPAPYQVRVFDEATLFAGKIHAIICRDFKSRVKGRDYYDYLFYIGKGTKVNIRYLENKLKNTGGIIDERETLTLERIKELLSKRFSMVDYELAKKDVLNFIEDKKAVDVWNKELFLSTLEILESSL